MHMVTSSFFLPTIVRVLSPGSQSKLLKLYLYMVLAWYVARGCPALDIEGLYGRPLPRYPSALPASMHNSVLSDSKYSPNPWNHLIEAAILHQDDHFCKIIRALAHFSGLYGAREAGGEDFANTKLKGAERVDGTLFLRAADLAYQRLNRKPTGYVYELWDFDNFPQQHDVAQLTNGMAATKL
jgi:hypothetical protein